MHMESSKVTIINIVLYLAALGPSSTLARQVYNANREKSPPTTGLAMKVMPG